MAVAGVGVCCWLLVAAPVVDVGDVVGPRVWCCLMSDVCCVLRVVSCLLFVSSASSLSLLMLASLLFFVFV